MTREDTRRKKPPNRWGCKPVEDVCVEHDAPLDCHHGCEGAAPHECAYARQLEAARIEQNNRMDTGGNVADRKVKAPAVVWVLLDHASGSVVDVTAASAKHLWARTGESVHVYRIDTPKPAPKSTSKYATALKALLERLPK